jgi:hypothetical protein
MALKLHQLPDRRPVKIMLTLSAEMSRKLQIYAELYRQSYGEEETIAELIPFMLQGFLESDKGFPKAVRAKAKTDET